MKNPAEEPISNLDELIGQMRPRLNPGVYVFLSLPADVEVSTLHPIATFRESEGLSVILEEAEGRSLGLPVLFRAAWITLTVRSDLNAVGLTAAVSTALARAGISCNVVAGAHHDHLFVPVELAENAMNILRDMQVAGVILLN